jgi:hypothetical protein
MPLSTDGGAAVSSSCACPEALTFLAYCQRLSTVGLASNTSMMLRHALSKLEEKLHLKPLPTDKPTQVGYGVHLGCGSFSNRARWAAVCLLTLCTVFLLIFYFTVHPFFILYTFMDGIAAALILMSMLCCGEWTVSIEQAAAHNYKPMRCSWGRSFRCNTFSTRLRWFIVCPIGLLVIGAMAAWVLPFCHSEKKSDPTCEDVCFCGLLVHLAMAPAPVALGLLATMCCCTEVPVPNASV